nr:hypothetical protein [Tanacetum cinerariifolium]
MSQDKSIPRRNKVDWHMANDDPLLTTMRFIPQHEVVQKYSAILPDYLTTQTMKDSKAYKTYHDLATGKVQPKPKYVCRFSRSKTEQAPKPFPGKDEDDNDQEDDDNIDHDDDSERTNSDNDGDDFVHPKFSTHNDEASQEEEVNGEESFDPIVQIPSQVKNTNDEDNDDDSHSMNVEGDELDDEGENKEDDGNELYKDMNINLEGRDIQIEDVQITQVIEDTHVTLTLVNPEDVPVTTTAEPPLLSATNLPPPSTLIILHLQQTPVPLPANVPSFSLQDLPNFGSLFGIVDKYINNRMNEAVKVAVQLQSDRLRDEAQVENEDFLNKLDENIQKIIKEQVKEQVKAQVSKILLKIKKTVNEQLEAEILTRLSSSFKTSHALAANLSEHELKKILIDKMESNKHRDEDKVKEPSAGSNQGSKGRRARKEQESTSAPKEKTSKTTGKSTEGSKSHHKSASESAQAEEPMHTTKDLEELAHQEFNTGDYNRLRIQDIEDMLLLLVQGKLINLTVDERLAFNASLSDLKLKEAYTSYSNPIRFIYQNKDKHNRLMGIDELHKFSDDTLNNVQTALDDRLKGIRMRYLPQTIWRRSDKDRAAAMI